MASKANLIFTISIGVIVAASLYAAFSTQETAQFAHESYISTHRAFVSVTKLAVQAAYSPSDPKQLMGWTFAPVVENSGPTATRSLELLAGVQSTGDPTGPKDPEVAFPTGNSISLVVGPHTTVTLPISLNSDLLIPNDTIQKVAKGQTALYVFGTAHYHDVFERTLLHITKYCFQVDATGDGAPGTKVSYHFCRFWNCADYECVADKAEHESAELQPAKPGE
ncbi:MAG TPA: hypothetical protein VGG64_05045 [Pirellulales bacterium]|jgi:hypothetical protein